jgi:hypothetical protein
LKYNKLGKIYVTGDFYSRTADLPDYFLFDKYLDENYPFVNRINIPERVNRDHGIDTHGRRLLDLCISTGLSIANVRVSHDRDTGDYTYCSHQEQSTVDYLLINRHDFDSLLSFEIFDFNSFSDHAPLAFSVRNNFLRNRDNDDIRRNFVHARTKYNKVKRIAKRKFKINEGKILEDLAKKNPRNFWKTLKKK